VGSDAARTQRFYTDLFDWTVGDSGFAGYKTVDTGTGRGIQGGLGGGEESRWATIYAGVADFGQVLSRAEELGGSRISDPGVPALKSAARAALYGSRFADDSMETGAFRDPAGNVFGIYHHGGLNAA
jgi:predicted enzyme related to lactoylglutathione lyase